jgi:uncharacterized RDD family membrane protein YckC
MISAALLATLVGAATVLLLIATNLDRRDPPDWALYVTASILLSWMPVWYIYTCLSWTHTGRTIGMRWARIRIVDGRGSPLGLPRAALRASALALLSAPLLLSPLAVFWAARLRLGPGSWLAGVLLALGLLSAAACLPPFFGFHRGAWHDLLAGSRVVRDQRRGEEHLKAVAG